MSGSKWQARVSSDLDGALCQYKEENGIEQDTEAVKQLLRRGVDDWKAEQNGAGRFEQPLLELGRVGVVAAVVGLLMAVGLQDAVLIRASVATLFAGLAGYSTVGIKRVRRGR